MTSIVKAKKSSPKKIQVLSRKNTESFTQDQKSIITKVWLELVDQRKIIPGQKPSNTSAYKILLEALRDENIEIAAALNQDPHPRSSKYNYLHTFIHRRSKGRGDESINSSFTESNASQNALLQGQQPY